MKNRLFKLGLYLFLGVGILGTTFTSCSSDDSNGVTNIAIDKGKYNTITGAAFGIDPQLRLEGAIYTWYNHTSSKVISNVEVLKYTFDEPGEYELSLKVQHNGQVELYMYAITVTKSVDYNYVTLDLSTFDLTEGVVAQGGKIWENTYVDKTLLKHQIFTFSHSSEYPATWDGFTVSNVKDNKNYNESGSAGFIENQWGAMPKGGIKGEGSPFLIGYWAYYGKDWQATKGVFEEDKYANWVKVGDGKETYKAVNVSIANHPWPYYGILYGDSFARKFKKGDYFKIMIYGVDKDNKIKSTPVTHYLADYRGDKLVMSTDWSTVDLSSLGEVSYLVFQMETTDAGDYGPNTAVYFCMDKLTVDKVE